MAQMQIITGVERRRRFSEEQKRGIVGSAFAPGANVSAVAREADISNGYIYRWRRLFHKPGPGFAKVVVAAEAAGSMDRYGSAVEVALGNGAHIRIPSSTPADLATCIVKALVRR